MKKLLVICLFILIGCGDVGREIEPSPVCGDNLVEGYEVCDGDDLGSNNNMCRKYSNGYYGGPIICSTDCTLDFSYCLGDGPTCGDGLVEAFEVCDGSDLRDETCQRQTGDDGVLLCSNDCKTFDTSGCGLYKDCGNEIVDATELCDGDNLGTSTCETLGFASGTLRCGDTCQFNTTSCQVLVTCGNNILDTMEECEGFELRGEICIDQGFDGGEISCSDTCMFNTSSCFSCGDGSINESETCDDGNIVDGDYCSSNCQNVTSVCGDGLVELSETCDDGNIVDNDNGCDALCQRNDLCGNGRVESLYETCDDGNIIDDDYCYSDCQVVTGFCGDGVVQINETCDDGNILNGDYCDGSCQNITGSCGDELVQTNEECDDGNTVGGDDYCSSDCQNVTGYCGDGIVQSTEQCDDGNTNNGDGCSAGCQSAGWSLATPAIVPTERSSYAMTYDSQRNVVVLFGGHNGIGLSDLWEWNGITWELRCDGVPVEDTCSNGPSSRWGTALAYDSVRGRVVLFGGTFGSNETWEWNGTDWDQRCNRAPASDVCSGPSARYLHAMAFDTIRGVTVLFGGWDGTSSNAETWEWNGSIWKQRCDGLPEFNVCGSRPLARNAHAMTYDSIRDKVVLFSGRTNGGLPLFNETWEFNGLNWTIVCDGANGCDGPSGRESPALTFDAIRNVTVMFAGRPDSGSTVSNELWEWDGLQWIELCGNTNICSPTPSARVSTGLAFDIFRNEIIAFGGWDGNIRNDTWRYRVP